MTLQSFEKEKIGKLLLMLSIPIVLEFLVREMYNMVDTFYVGRYVGGAGIAALMVVFPVQRLFAGISVLLGTGTATLMSNSIGKSYHKRGKTIVVTGANLLLMIVLPFILLINVFRDPILTALGASETILPLAKQYLTIVSIGSLFLIATGFLSYIMISLGDTKVSILSTTIGAVVNVVIDFITIVLLGWGVFGAAIATCISQIIAFSVAALFFKKKDLKIEWQFKIHRQWMISILLVGLSAFIIEVEDSVNIAVLNNLLSDTMGDAGIIVLGVATKVYMFLFIAVLGIASAMRPIAAYNYGADNETRMKKLVQTTMKYAFLATMVLWVLMMMFTRPLLGIFVRDPFIIEEAVSAFRVMISLFPLLSVYYTKIFQMQAKKEVTKAVASTLVRQMGIMIPVAVFLVHGMNMGAMGVWLAYPISDVLATLFVLGISDRRFHLPIPVGRERSIRANG